MSKCQPPWVAPLFNLDRDMRTRVLTNPSNNGISNHQQLNFPIAWLGVQQKFSKLCWPVVRGMHWKRRIPPRRSSNSEMFPYHTLCIDYTLYDNCTWVWSWLFKINRFSQEIENWQICSTYLSDEIFWWFWKLWYLAFFLSKWYISCT